MPLTAIDRAIGLLRILAEQDGPTSLTEVARKAEMPAASVHRMFSILQSYGLVEHDRHSRSYKLGYGLVVLAQAALRSSAQYRDFSPFLAQVRDTWNEACYVSTLIGDSAVCLQMMELNAPHRTYFYNRPGQMMPLHSSAAGKVLLAHQRPEVIRSVLDRIELPVFTSRTITDRHCLEQNLALIREQGYALCEEELEIGVSAVAVPLRSVSGEVSHCLVVVAPTARLKMHLANGLVIGLQTISQRINACLI